MKTLFTAFQSRGSVAADRLIFTSGMYVIVTAGDDAYGRWNGTAASAVQCGKDHDLYTTDKDLAWKMWEEYTESHIYK